MKITKNQIKNTCIVLTLGVCLCTIIMVIFEFFYGSGNHRMLFGSWIDSMLFQYPGWIALFFSAPMVVPFAVHQSRKNLKLLLLGILSFFLLYRGFVFLTD